MPTTLDAPTLREAMARYLEALEVHREEIDSLNVFPVPDGDTGTNMLLTQRAVVEALDGEANGSLGALGQAIARAALMGARGNSGVILSQILRGFCERYCVELDAERDERLDGTDLARALAAASEEARKAVAKPVEGTILSVLREAAEAAGEAGADQVAVCERALEAAKEALERTTEALPDLKQAGVVDAGAKGFVLLLDALVSALKGVPLSIEVGPGGPVGHPERADPPAQRYGYEVMYVLHLAGPFVEQVKGRLAEIGDSLVVVGGGDLYQVHVHTDDPGLAVEEGIRSGGRLERIRISSLDEQVAEHCVATDGLREVQAADGTSGPLVAVAEGAGLEELFRSLGAVIVRGGPGNNPSVEELVRAIDAAPDGRVFVLPNHPNVWPAAEAAGNEIAREVEVIHARSVPQALAAALAYVPGVSDGTSMFVSAEETGSARIARAEKAAASRAGPVTAGDWVAIDDLDGEIWAVGEDPEGVAVAIVRDRLVADHRELITLYAGADATDEDAERVADALREAFPELEVEVRRGDQPRYPYLIGVE